MFTGCIYSVEFTH